MSQTSEYQVGETYNLLEHLEDPYAFYAALREQETIFFSPDINAWLVPHYDDVRAILAQPEVFSSRDFTRPLPFTEAALEVMKQGYPPTPVSIDSDGIEHQRRRGAHVKGFSAASMKKQEEPVRILTHRLIDTFINDGHADLVSQYAYPLTLETVLRVLGVPLDHVEEVKQASRDMAELAFGSIRTEEEQVASAKRYVAFQKYMGALIAQRRVDPVDDELNALIYHQVTGAAPLSESELVNAATGFLAAGHRSALDACGNAFVILLQNPSLWKKICEQPALIPSFVEEVLRYEAPVQTLFRVTTREVEIRDVKLPEGARIVLLLGSANRDGQQFPDADTFDVQRAPNRHTTFGHGVHFCIGAPLGRLEIRLAMETLVERIPMLHLVQDQQLKLNPMLLFRGYGKIEVEW